MPNATPPTGAHRAKKPASKNPVISTPSQESRGLEVRQEHVDILVRALAPTVEKIIRTWLDINLAKLQGGDSCEVDGGPRHG